LDTTEIAVLFIDYLILYEWPNSIKRVYDTNMFVDKYPGP